VRRLCLLAVGALALLTGCGDDGDTNAELDTSGLSAITQLTDRQYRAIDHAQATDVRVGRLSRSGRLNSRSRRDAANTRVLRACAALDGTDPLLRELFGSCAAEAHVFVPLLDTCASPETCQEAVMTSRLRLDGVAAAYGRHNRAVRATSLPPACKQALTQTRADYAHIRRQRPIFEQIENAIKAQSKVRLDRALAKQKRLEGRALSDARRALRRLRAGCR